MYTNVLVININNERGVKAQYKMRLAYVVNECLASFLSTSFRVE